MQNTWWLCVILISPKQYENQFHSFTCMKTISIQNHTGETAVSLQFHSSRGYYLPIPLYAKDA